MRYVSGAVLGWLVSVPAFAAHVKTFDLPGQTAICGHAIADNGTIVGNAVPPAGSAASPANFIYQAGKITNVTAQLPAGAALTGVNSAGLITGFTLASGGGVSLTEAGFTFKGGTVTAFSLPGTVFAALTGVSTHGVLIGFDQTAGVAAQPGFVDRSGHVTALTGGGSIAEPTGMSANGKLVVGLTFGSGSGSITSWLYQAGAYTPVAVPGAVDTLVGGVNDAGLVSGTYATPGTGGAPVLHGFLLKGGVYSTVDIAGARATELEGLNTKGVATGCVTNSTGTHGLIYTP